MSDILFKTIQGVESFLGSVVNSPVARWVGNQSVVISVLFCRTNAADIIIVALAAFPQCAAFVFSVEANRTRSMSIIAILADCRSKGYLPGIVVFVTIPAKGGAGAGPEVAVIITVVRRPGRKLGDLEEVGIDGGA